MKKQYQSNIFVVGSSNTDMVVKTKHLPRSGETVIGGSFFMNPGGKGANQAVAAARLGGKVKLICKTGNDFFGNMSRLSFEEEGIDTSFVLSDYQNPSGVALIMVDDKGENCIAVASGSNANLLPLDMAPVVGLIKNTDIVLMQLEIPLTTVKFLSAVACYIGATVILNPAPAMPLFPNIFKDFHILTPNETEAEMLSGVKIVDEASAEKAARVIAEMGVQYVIITLGAKGALVFDRAEGKAEIIAAPQVVAVDTTAAGDVFNGALAVAIAQKQSIAEAARFACKAAAISVTRQGAQSSAPYRKEVDSF
ncbi:MAG: ribokinase [Tannerellaceae bacterium]|nr:ribokinase [Tannerellaceae bacterium]